MIRFNRMEFAGSLGDLGTLLPLAVGMITINGMNASGLFFSVGVFYVICGLYYRVTVPVQPMKAIGAYAIVTAMPASQIAAAGLIIGMLLLIVGATGFISLIGRYTPRSVIRGVQLSTGVLLMGQGIRFMIGTSTYQRMHQMAEPSLAVQSLGPVPIGILLGGAGVILTLMFLDNPKIPAGLLIVIGGMLVGLVLGAYTGLDQVRLQFDLPMLLPLGLPSRIDFTLACFLLVMPQIPMTVGNAVIAYADLSKDYFGEQSRKVTYRSTCLTMALGNFLAFILGGMPLCHGAGGLAAHYRFGARTAGSNIMIGSLLALMSLCLGSHMLALLNCIPMAVLGVLLLYAGSQLAMTMIDLQSRKDLFVAVVMLGVTLSANLAAAFIAGLVLAFLLKSSRLSV